MVKWDFNVYEDSYKTELHFNTYFINSAQMDSFIYKTVFQVYQRAIL